MELGDYVGKLSIVRVIWHPTINLNGHLLFLQYNCLWKLNIFTLSSWMFRFWSFLRSFARNVISEKCFLGNSLEFCKERRSPPFDFLGGKSHGSFLTRFPSQVMTSGGLFHHHGSPRCSRARKIFRRELQIGKSNSPWVVCVSHCWKSEWLQMELTFCTSMNHPKSQGRSYLPSQNILEPQKQCAKKVKFRGPNWP